MMLSGRSGLVMVVLGTRRDRRRLFTTLNDLFESSSMYENDGSDTVASSVSSVLLSRGFATSSFAGAAAATSAGISAITTQGVDLSVKCFAWIVALGVITVRRPSRVPDPPVAAARHERPMSTTSPRVYFMALLNSFSNNNNNNNVNHRII